MLTQSRIPKLYDTTFDGALLWFSQMECSNLLFHPEDDPANIIRISSDERLFSDGEVIELNFLLNELEQEIGHEKLIEAAYPVFMNACGIQLDA
ncbi:MAG: hypothetical protein M0Z83_06385 [Betaproteobacteria bacterium]|nr:hypothetical protein [Betaproteobacteria bacterium]